MQNGTYLDGEEITVAEFVDMWLRDYAEKQLAPSTRKSYKMRLKRSVVPALGHIKLAKLQPHHLLEFYNNLAEGGIRLDMSYKPKSDILERISTLSCNDIGVSFKTWAEIKRGGTIREDTAKRICKCLDTDFKNPFVPFEKSEKLSPKTIKHHHDLISSMLTTAVRWNLIASNPAERVEPPKVERKQADYYDDEQVAQLLTLLEDAPIKYRTTIYLTIDTGLRLSEVAGLLWSDFDLDNCELHVSRQRQYVSGYGLMERVPKTQSGVRVVSVSQTVIDLLRKYRLHQLENKMLCGDKWQDSENVFKHEDGSAMFPSRPYKWFVEFLDKNSLPHITFHQLRHTNASLLIAEGVDVVSLSSRLGHADKNVTMNVYSHVIKSKEKQVVNKMENIYNRLSQVAK